MARTQSIASPAYIRSYRDLFGVKEKLEPTWTDLRNLFRTHIDQRIAMGKLQTSTAERYELTLSEFHAFLLEEKITQLRQITKPLVERFKIWRIGRIKKRKQSRGATGVVLDIAILHRVFTVAVDSELISEESSSDGGQAGGESNERSGAVHRERPLAITGSCG